MTLALEGIRVIEVAQAAAAPMGGRFLADWGADVIHVEHPIKGDLTRAFLRMTKGGHSQPSKVGYMMENYNRNKKSFTLDHSKENSREIMRKLIEKADVFITNIRRAK